MNQTLQLGDIEMDVIKKDIKNVHLSVYPPTGRVRISAPKHMSLDTIRVFAISKLDWIKREKKKLIEQERETPREYLDRESHYVWGKRYLLKVKERDAPPEIELKHSTLVLYVRPGADEDRKQAIIAGWYRRQVREATTSLIAKWEPLMGVKVSKFFVQQMKTKWGSCNPAAGNIRLNSELGKKPKECLEYIVVHEMTHLLEKSHNQRFVSYMDCFMPHWQSYRDTLNRLPVRHEDWKY